MMFYAIRDHQFYYKTQNAPTEECYSLVKLQFFTLTLLKINTLMKVFTFSKEANGESLNFWEVGKRTYVIANINNNISNNILGVFFTFW